MPGRLGTWSHIDDDDDAHDVDDDCDDDDDENDYDNDDDVEFDYDDDDNEDGDGDEELTLHSSRCVHECALRPLYLPSEPANRTAALGGISGQHHGPG